MTARSQSTLAIWVACIGIGLLYFSRTFQNFIEPMFGSLSQQRFSFTQIWWLANAFVFPQSVCAPLVGWYADRTSIRLSILTCIFLGTGAFIVISTAPAFAVSFIAVFSAGLAFILGKISLNTILVLHSSHESLRRSVAKRATLLNLGSFLGNSFAQKAPSIGYSSYAMLLSLFYLPIAGALFVKPSPDATRKKTTFRSEHFKTLLHNRVFIADALRRFALTLPYGCWGTVISTYLIHLYGSNIPVWRNSITNLLTTLFGAHFLAVYLSAKLYRSGFKWEWWSITSVFLYCIGLLLLTYAANPFMLVIAVVIFTSGEVLMTPCFDETAKKHSGEDTMSTCMGLLHLVDGAGRWIGMSFALAVYGLMKSGKYLVWYWPVVVTAFLLVSGSLHVVCHFFGNTEASKISQTEPSPDIAPDIESLP